MTTLSFKTNIDCPLRVRKAVCALECLRGRYCRFSLDLMQADHILTVTSDELEHKDVIKVLNDKGLICQTLSNQP